MVKKNITWYDIKQGCMATRLYLSLFILYALTACNKYKTEGNVQTNSTFADTLRLSSEAIQVGANTFYLKTSLWRDFMPQSPPNGKPLICVSDLIEKDSLPIPANVKLIKQYVVYGNDIWTDQYSGINSYQSFILEGTTRNGPKWGPDVLVDVICEFQIGNSIFRLIARQQKIIRTV